MYWYLPYRFIFIYVGLRIKSLRETCWGIADQGICKFCVVRNVRVKRCKKAGNVGNKRDAKKDLISVQHV